jgi:hypothetical protein
MGRGGREKALGIESPQAQEQSLQSGHSAFKKVMEWTRIYQ